MKCINPRRLPNKNSKNPPFDSYILVSCNKCYACLANRRRSWLFRLHQENIDSSITLFCSFTYSDEFRPYDHKLNKKHLQDFFKRLRNFEDFTYYAIGEYGSTSKREHYHAVIFFKSPHPTWLLDDYDFLIRDLWPFGNVSVSRATYRRLNYILHYHTRPKQIDGKPTFQLFSKGLGISFIDHSFLRYLVDTGSSIIHDYNGAVYVIPRYYRKKLKDMLILTPLGFDTIPDVDFIMDLKRDDDECLKVFGKHIYELSSKQYVSYIRDKVGNDSRKLKKYNNQDKL